MNNNKFYIFGEDNSSSSTSYQDAALKELTDAQTNLKQAKSDLENLKSSESNAKSAYEAAKSNYEEAKKEFDSKYSSKEKALEKAKSTESKAKDKYDSAISTYNSALNNQQEAEAYYNKVKDNPALNKEALNNLNSANKKLTSALNDKNTAEKEYNAAKSAVTTAQNELGSSYESDKAKVESFKTAYDNAKSNYENKQQEVKNKEAEIKNYEKQIKGLNSKDEIDKEAKKLEQEDKDKSLKKENIKEENKEKEKTEQREVAQNTPYIAYDRSDKDKLIQKIAKINNATENTISDNSTANILDIKIPNWGISDFIIERANWQKQITSISGEPGWFYFKIFFDFTNSEGLFGDIIQDTNVNGNTAFKYFLYLYQYYAQEKLLDRLKALVKFVCLLSYINCQAPWFFKSISGLDKANNMIYTKDFNKEKSIEIGCSEDAIDMRLNLLMDLYKYAAYDDINCKEILPENLRKFNMTILVFSTPVKYYQTAIKTSGGGSYAYKKFTPVTELSSEVNNVQGSNESANDNSSNISSNSTLTNFSNSLSYKMFTFHNCEFMELGYMMGSNLSNERPNSLGKSSIKIKYDRVYTHTMNEWNDIMFGSDGFQYMSDNSNIDINKNLEEKIDSSFNNGESDPLLTSNASATDFNKSRLLELSNALSSNTFDPTSDNYKYIVDLSESLVNDALIGSNGTLGNLYNYYSSISDTNNYFKNKLAFLKEGTVSGNIFNYDLGADSPYFTNKMHNVKEGTVSGNIYEYNLGRTGGPDNRQNTEYLNKKNKNIHKGVGSGNIYDYDFGRYGETKDRKSTKYYSLKLSNLHKGTVTGSIYEYEMGRTGSGDNRKNTEYLNLKNKSFHSGTQKGNIYDYDFNRTGNSDKRQNTEYFNTKLANMHEGTIEGNMYQYEIGRTGTGDNRKNTGYLDKKNKAIHQGTSEGNIYDYDFNRTGSGSNRQNTTYYNEKMHNFHEGTIGGNLYNFDLGRTGTGSMRKNTTYLELKLNEIKGNGIQYIYNSEGAIISVGQNTNNISDNAVANNYKLKDKNISLELASRNEFRENNVSLKSFDSDIIKYGNDNTYKVTKQDPSKKQANRNEFKENDFTVINSDGIIKENAIENTRTVIKENPTNNMANKNEFKENNIEVKIFDNDIKQYGKHSSLTTTNKYTQDDAIYKLGNQNDYSLNPNKESLLTTGETNAFDALVSSVKSFSLNNLFKSMF